MGPTDEKPEAKDKLYSFKVFKKQANFSGTQVAVFIAVFALIGGYIIWRSFAASPLVASLESEQMMLPGGASVITDPGASGGKAVQLTSNGTLTGTVNFPSAVNSLTLTAEGTQCSGSPNASIAIDGSTVLNTTSTSSTSWNAYSVTTNLTSGTHNISITGSNIGTVTIRHGKKSSTCSRYLSVDITNFYGPAPPPTPPPTVAISASPSSINAGQASSLIWTSTYAISCSASGAWSGSQPTTGSVSTGALNQTSTYNLSCTGDGGTAQASTTVTVNGGTSYLFDDEFNGISGAPADTSKWILHDEKCDAPANYSCPKNSNVFQDGAGHLVLRTKRESSNWLGGGLYSGAWVSTFNYGYGWPPPTIKAGFSVPYHIEMSAKMPGTTGGWSVLWPMNVDRSTAQGIYELDVAEERMTYPTSAGCHQHYWLNGSDQKAWDGSVTVTDMGKNWHTYAADVYSDHVTYSVDGLTCGTAYGVSGKFGIILDNAIGSPGSWGSGGSQPNLSDPGPWDFAIDYIRVSPL